MDKNMYVPPHFDVPGKDILEKIMPAASFATLISTGGEGIPYATHLPVSYDPDYGDLGLIYAHVARANPHWKYFGEKDSLVIFQGPHAYISPSYYATKINVPTWNYVAVHAYGRPRILDDPSESLRVVQRLTSDNEDSMGAPWTTDHLDEKRLNSLIKAIVAFEIPVTRLEGKAKLGQNKALEDQTAVHAAIGDLLK
jgi:transcriptional regulator